MPVTIGRRELLAALGGAVAVWPLAARAQQGERVRRIGVLMHLAADDPEGQARHATFVQGLQQSGWSAGRNVRIDTRWGTSEADRRKYAAELVALAPDVILASNSQATLALQAATSTVPIVFATSPIPSPPALSRVWHGRAAMPLVLPCLNTASARSGWSCSRRLPPA